MYMDAIYFHIVEHCHMQPTNVFGVISTLLAAATLCPRLYHCAGRFFINMPICNSPFTRGEVAVAYRAGNWQSFIRVTDVRFPSITAK